MSEGLIFTIVVSLVFALVIGWTWAERFSGLGGFFAGTVAFFAGVVFFAWIGVIHPSL